MACETLSTPGQGCLNIPLIRGDYREVPIAIVINGEAIDLSTYAIKMEIRQGGGTHFPPVSVRTEADLQVNGNEMTVTFEPDDAVYQRDYKTLFYDISFTKDGVTKHWIKGQISITKSETVTWQM